MSEPIRRRGRITGHAGSYQAYIVSEQGVCPLGPVVATPGAAQELLENDSVSDIEWLVGEPELRDEGRLRFAREYLQLQLAEGLTQSIGTTIIWPFCPGNDAKVVFSQRLANADLGVTMIWSHRNVAHLKIKEQ